MRVLLRHIGAATVALSALAIIPMSEAIAHADPATPHTQGAQEAVVRAGDRAADQMSPARVHFGWCDLYVPTFFRPVNGTYDLIVHFHGIPELQEHNVDRTRINAVVVSVNMGISSGVYANAFASAAMLDALLTDTQRALDKTGRAPGARLGRLALSAWSAGFAAVGSLLKFPSVADRVDAVLLADGLHANYLGDHSVNPAALASFVRFADQAKRGEKLFALTHSSVPTSGYPSTTETVGELLRLTEMRRTPTAAPAPRGMRPIYDSHQGQFHVEGFEGTTAKDHIDQIKGMDETLLPFLLARWTT
jgi:hypothetical protein